MSLTWRSEFSANGCIQQLFRATQGDLTFDLKVDGAGFWSLSCRRAIPFDQEKYDQVMTAWVKAESAWASDQEYEVPRLGALPETDEYVGCDSPPNYGRGWSVRRVQDWATKAVKQWLQ